MIFETKECFYGAEKSFRGSQIYCVAIYKSMTEFFVKATMMEFPFLGVAQIFSPDIH
jgi:hypothetical protein